MRQIEQQQQQRVASSDKVGNKAASMLSNAVELTLKKDAKLSNEVIDLREVFVVSSDKYGYEECAAFINQLRASMGRSQSSFRYTAADGQVRSLHFAGALGNADEKRDELRHYVTHPFYREQDAIAMPFIDDSDTICLYLRPSRSTLGEEIYVVAGSDRRTVGAFFHLLAFYQSVN